MYLPRDPNHPDRPVLPLSAATPSIPDVGPSVPHARGGWIRVSSQRPCPICGRPDWCGVAADGSAAACMRVELGSVRRLKNGAWLHRFGDDDPRRPTGGALPAPAAPPPAQAIADAATAALKLRRLMDGYRRAATPRKLDGLAAKLGLSSRRPLDDLGVGWSAFHPGFAFPCRDGLGRLVGVQVRREDGMKRLLRGSRQGLFLPWNLRQLSTDTPLVVCEGASDTAACLDLAHRHQADLSLPALPWRAIGRPNWACGGEELLVLVQSLHPDANARVAVMADNEAAGDGRRGARELAELLRPHVRRVEVLIPAAGAKDLRERVTAGLTPSAFAALLRR